MSPATEPFYRFNVRVGMECLGCSWKKSTVNNQQQAIEHLIETGHQVHISITTRIVPETKAGEPR